MIKIFRLQSASVILITSAMVFADTTTQPATQPVAFAGSTQPTTVPTVLFARDIGPATQPSPSSVLGAMDAAYAGLPSIELNGHITGDFDVDGDRQKFDVPFTSAFAAPNKFRHDAQGDILLGSTGTKAYALLSQRDAFQSFDAPKTRVPSGEWPASIVKILVEQNPSLLLVMSKSAAAELKELSAQIVLQPPTVIDGISFDTLQFDVKADHQVITMLVDPNTHLLRRVQFDKRKPLEKQGATDVKTAMITVDYTRCVPGAALPADQFAWSAPVGAMQAASAVAMADAGDGLSDEQKALLGKPASDFTVTGLDDKPMTLSTQKGSVVVLDFWATWCGPCVASLPHLNSLYNEQAPSGLKVFALDQREQKPLVSSFVQKKGWSIPILLDSDGTVAEAYKVSGIPQTVIIGKDGIVKQIYVGSGHEKEIAAEVAKQMQ